ncbi:MAG TPA: hypothetical protein VFB00_11175 [Terriglobales bacterium]|nr:hypothetical protein [Terriglobales bacterium]
MFSKLLDVLFGCRHVSYSFPMSARAVKQHPSAGSLTGTYVVCLECGKEFAYDWKTMKVMGESASRHAEIRSSFASRQVARS